MPSTLPDAYRVTFLGWVDNNVVACSDRPNPCTCRRFTEGGWEDIELNQSIVNDYGGKASIFQLDLRTLLFVDKTKISTVDFKTGEVQSMKPDYEPLEGCLVTRLNDTHLMFTGGRDYLDFGSDLTFIYEPATNSMTPGPRLRHPRMLHFAGLATTSDGTRMVVVSEGQSDYYPVRGTEVLYLDKDPDRWHNGPSLPDTFIYGSGSSLPYQGSFLVTDPPSETGGFSYWFNPDAFKFEYEGLTGYHIDSYKSTLVPQGYIDCN